MNVVVVGSGASAVHFAQTALDRGLDVTMLDVGRAAPPAVRPEDSFEKLKSSLERPDEYLLGRRFEAVAPPGDAKEYYGFPPHKSYVFEGVNAFRHRSRGFAPLLSFAEGGLAETWTAGAFPFHDDEMVDFPWERGTLAPYYDRVAERIGITGVEDDLTRVVPFHRHLMEPLRLDEHSRALLERAGARRGDLLRDAGCLVGRSRVATLSRPYDGRPACTYTGRCLLGCPTGALYTPSMTLARCRTNPRFTYRSGLLVRRFIFDEARRVREVVAEELAGGGFVRVPVDVLVLAAGTLATSKIVLDSWQAATGASLRLGGLMDNRQVLVPFVNLSRLGRAHDPDTYQYHQVALALLDDDSRLTTHALVTTLKTAMIHPIVKSLPIDLAAAIRIFGDAHAALGLVNVNFPDRRRGDCFVTVEPVGGDADGAANTTLHVTYAPEAGEAPRRDAVLRRVRRALGLLGCFVPPGMSHVRPMGASVHYAGTIPMTMEAAPWTATPNGRCREFENLWLADGTTFPFLPAKNLTLTLMANATRIADRVAGGER